MGDARVLDEIKIRFNLNSDADLAALLGVTRTTIHNIRNKGGRLGFKSKLLLIDKIAYLRPAECVETWAGKLTTASLLSKIRHKNQEITLKKSAQEITEESIVVADKDLIDEVKAAFSCTTDQELAEMLGVARNTISAIRSGSTSLGPQPRLRILHLIEPFDIEAMHEALNSTDKLTELIKDWPATQCIAQQDAKEDVSRVSAHSSQAAIDRVH